MTPHIDACPEPQLTFRKPDRVEGRSRRSARDSILTSTVRRRHTNAGTSTRTVGRGLSDEN
jgi:hypothetical protein